MRESLGARRSLREKVLGGDIGGAIALSDELFPGLLTAQPTVLFLLRCQGFIELVRSRDEMGALTYAQEHLHAYQEDAAVARHHPGMLRDVVALLAYADPAASADASCARLLADSHRELVADALSGAVRSATASTRRARSRGSCASSSPSTARCARPTAGAARPLSSSSEV